MRRKIVFGLFVILCLFMVTGCGSSTEEEFNKKQGSDEVIVDSSIIGAWEKDDVLLVFDLEMNGYRKVGDKEEDYYYTFDENQLVIHYSDSLESFEYQLDGNQLTLTSSSGEAFTYTRTDQY